MCLAFPSRHDRSLQIIPLNRSRFHSSSRLQFFTRSPLSLPFFHSSFHIFWGFICHSNIDLRAQSIFVPLKALILSGFVGEKGRRYCLLNVLCDWKNFCMINNLTSEMCFDRHNPPAWSQLAYTGLWRHASIIVSFWLYNCNAHASGAHRFFYFFFKSLD